MIQTSSVSKESIYGWYPPHVDDEQPKRTPIDIYMNLGARFPKSESFIETEVLKECVKEIHAEQSKESEKPEKAVEPPWGLCFQPTPNKPDDSLLFRSKSAPVTKYWKPKKPSLNIPKPELYNLFSGEAKHVYFSSTGFDLKKKEEKKEKLEKQVFTVPKVDLVELGETTYEIVTPALVEAHNFGKSPIITKEESDKSKKRSKKFRPKTVTPTCNSPVLLSQMNRSRTSVSMRKTPVIEIEPVVKEVVHAQPEDYSKITRGPSAKGNRQLMENWKSNLLEREKFLQPRPNYFVKIDLDKLKPDRPAPEVHYSAAETYFYNTMPYRKATFTINPNFISENLNVQKIDLKLKAGRGSSMEPVKYRRDYAFVY